MSLDLTTRCWPHPSVDADGYSRLTWGTRADRHGTSYHKLFYETFVGPVPEGMVLDHVCRNTRCCNPDHLEPVTNAENLRRGEGSGGVLYSPKTHCKRGHALTEDNVVGQRQCRTCKRANDRDRAKIKRMRMKGIRQ